MNCRCVVNLMSAYVDGELTGAEMLGIRRHLSGCAECMDEYELERMTKMAVSRLRTVAPRPDFAVSILSRLDEAIVPGYQRFLNNLYVFTRKKLSPVAAALAASGVALAILSAGGGDRILVQNPDVVATAPLNLRVQDEAFMPKVPDNPIAYSTSKPLVVANETNGPSFQLASLSAQ